MRDDEQDSREMPVEMATRLYDAMRIAEARAKNAFEVGFPVDKERKKALGNFIARFQGIIPDAYDRIAAAVQLTHYAYLNRMAAKVLERASILPRENGEKWDWSKIGEHPLVKVLDELTVSMGSGKGRKEIGEWSKVTPTPQKQRFRWGLQRE